MGIFDQFAKDVLTLEKSRQRRPTVAENIAGTLIPTINQVTAPMVQMRAQDTITGQYSLDPTRRQLASAINPEWGKLAKQWEGLEAELRTAEQKKIDDPIKRTQMLGEIRKRMNQVSRKFNELVPKKDDLYNMASAQQREAQLAARQRGEGEDDSLAKLAREKRATFNASTKDLDNTLKDRWNIQDTGDIQWVKDYRDTLSGSLSDRGNADNKHALFWSGIERDLERINDDNIDFVLNDIKKNIVNRVNPLYQEFADIKNKLSDPSLSDAERTQLSARRDDLANAMIAEIGTLESLVTPQGKIEFFNNLGANFATTVGSDVFQNGDVTRGGLNWYYELPKNTGRLVEIYMRNKITDFDKTFETAVEDFYEEVIDKTVGENLIDWLARARGKRPKFGSTAEYFEGQKNAQGLLKTLKSFFDFGEPKAMPKITPGPKSTPAPSGY